MSKAVQGSLTTFIAGLTLFSAAALAAPSAREEAIDLGKVQGAQFTLRRDGAPEIRYVISHPAQKSPLVLYIQGSGCIPPFIGLGTPKRSSTIFSWVPLAQQARYAVMVVDKPYQPEEEHRGQAGSAQECPKVFNDYFSYDRWLATLVHAVRHASTLPYVDTRRILVIGLSEGATMAAGLARVLPEVTDVALSGGSGPTQLFDFAVNIYRSDADDADKLRRLQELDATVSDINANPSSTGKFAWGHTYLRWSSFFAQSSADNLAHSKARVYLASGMQDNSVPILSTEAMYAQLRVQGRDVSFRRLPHTGHDMVPPGGNYADVQMEYDAIMAWFEHR
jgi:dipeptidyl aminopeptidase/acylaminoacyl peptidase